MLKSCNVCYIKSHLNNTGAFKRWFSLFAFRGPRPTVTRANYYFIRAIIIKVQG